MIAFIGGGNMAEALVRGLPPAARRDVVVAEPREERRRHLAGTLGVRVMAANREAIADADIIVMAVKPQNMDDVTAELRDVLPAEAVVVSIAAGVTLGYLRERLGTSRLIRVMPNVASLAGQGMAVMALCECLDDRAVAAVRDIFMASGRVLTLPEKHLDAVTALSGSGPAFIARFVGLMEEAGVSLGLPEEGARELALQTLTGTAALLEGGLTAEELVQKVRSPGGTTAEGLRVFDERGLREDVFEALSAAARRAQELSQ